MGLGKLIALTCLVQNAISIHFPVISRDATVDEIFL